MAEARSREEWDRAATIAAMIAEVHRDREVRSEPFTLFDFHPLRGNEWATANVVDVDIRELKAAFDHHFGHRRRA